MTSNPLARKTVEQILAARGPAVLPEALEVAQPIVRAVKERGEAALREYAERFGEIAKGADLVIGRDALRGALEGLPRDDRARLERVAARIRGFAEAQRAALNDVEVTIPGGCAGHHVSPVERAGCYAPGGRYPLPSSVLMTAVTARVAGVSSVWVASPKPSAVTLAAAAVAGAEAVLAAGGAHGIAALAHGAGPVPACDVIVGPGNRYVTAAKHLVSGNVRIDQLAGPSELVVLADAAADPALVAADLIAQAEHDPDALPVLVTTDEDLVAAVNRELARQLMDLPTAGIATPALAHGGAVVARSLEDAIEACDLIAPEHLEVIMERAEAVAARLGTYGGLFVGAGAAEVLGDYGAGPNHVLPTGGSARSRGGLSVLDFVRVNTWMRIDDPEAAGGLVDDAMWLAGVEGLEGHRRAGGRRGK